MVTQSQLKELLDYNSETGTFKWLIDVRRSRAGDVAGHLHSKGYIAIKIGRRDYYAHRLAWMYCYGQFPNGNIDHINRNRSDNRICNLRIANHVQNGQNLKTYRNNTSGVIGVNWNKRTSKWKSEIDINGKRFYLGLFNTIEEASEARAVAKAKYHTFHPEDNNEKAT